MRPELIRRYAAQGVPRYTSYPTAAEFTPDIGPAEHAAWLATLSPRESVSLYIHVPYCREICHYCGCTTKMALRNRVLADYQQHMDAEIQRVGSVVAQQLKVGHLHWGGGTPSILGIEGLARILDSLSAHFRLVEGAEHAIELDPRTVTPDLARGLARLGVNRVSLGVQDLEPAVQIAIGRVQSLARVERAFDALHDAGLTKINVDLIYGLPLQTRASVAETARRVVALGPDRVACYGYAHLPQRKRNQRLIDASRLPDPVERYFQAQAIAAVFAGAGYDPVGIDHFARPSDPLARAAREGRLRRNFQGYTDDHRETLVGFGASAISHFQHGFVQNHPDPGAYARALERGLLPAGRGCRFSEDDRVRGHIIEALMCNFRVDLNLFGSKGAFGAEIARLQPLVRDGLVTERDGVVAMSELGRPFVRLVATLFDAYRTEQTRAFSVAV